ncbi:hypothetical protein MTR67_046953 [Solanum verrucosum]|uniref:Glycosyltransferase N-terminal domain-containing protein n=1 Tax=Solanum verrucosum TaxID=315347 RepID=A0AAF0ZXQ3_SOLVR|nr:hypothetical protein MTR67_046953 [Solanum verrucosum]
MAKQVTEPLSTLRVLMFPFLAYGHISPFLNVAKKLADREFLIYLYSTPINLKYASKKIPEKYADSIQLVELHLPELPELPPHYHTTNDLPHHLHHTLQKALKMSKPNFSKILENLKPDLVIYDILQQWAERVANEHNIPAVKLLTSGATVFSYFTISLNKPEDVFPFPEIYLRKSEQVKMNETLKCAKEIEPDEGDRQADGNRQIMLMSTSRIIEDKYIDYCIDFLNLKVIPVGPPVQDSITDDADDMELIDWLGTKDENSTVFVSFGSEYFLSKEDMEEVAFGLELSNVNFIWVARFPKGEERNHEDALPKVMESIDFGVPIIAMPMHLEQPMNARLIVELGVAVEIVRDNNGKIHREEIAEILKCIITGETGENLRAKVRDISKNLKSVRGEEMDAAAQELIQLCRNSNKCK